MSYVGIQRSVDMDDLISRHELLKQIRMFEEEYKDKLKGIAYIKFLIRDVPTIDAQPVRHGRWIECAEQKHIEKDYECSECSYKVCGEYECTSFCGGCGAIMDGDSKRDKMLKDTIVELCEAKRLLKAAVEDIHELLCDKKNLGGNGQSCNICSHIEHCPCCGECTVREDLRNWRYADEALKLIEEDGDGE